jgi:hypothetical protein
MLALSDPVSHTASHKDARTGATNPIPKSATRYFFFRFKALSGFRSQTNAEV